MLNVTSTCHWRRQYRVVFPSGMATNATTSFDFCFSPFSFNFFCALGQQKNKAFQLKSRKMRWWPNLVSSQEELLQRKNFVKKQFIFDSLFRGQTLHKHYPQLNCKLRLKPGPKTTILYLVIRQPALVALKNQN